MGLILSICFIYFGPISVSEAQAGWFSDTICCNSGSLVGNGDGNAGANLSGSGSSGGGITTQPGYDSGGYSTYGVAQNIADSLAVPAGYTTHISSNSQGGYDVYVVSLSSSGSSGGGTIVPTTDAAPIGEIESLGRGYAGPNTSCDAIVGWACDTDFRNNPVQIHMYVDGKLYTSFATNEPRPGLINPSWNHSTYGPGCGGPSTNALWGYRYITPEVLKDGVRREVKLYAINQGIRGNTLNVQLPHETWSGGRTIPLQCNAPKLAVNLAAGIDSLAEQMEEVPFIITAKAFNSGASATKVPFTLRVQIDKKTGTAATGWLYEGNGINGDVRLQTSIAAGLTPGATSTYNFTNVLLPVGEYRMRAIADPDHVVEASTSRQLANNTTGWTYFTVKINPNPPVAHPDLSFQSFAITAACDTSTMIGSGKCPSTGVSFFILNGGDKAIDSGVGVPYTIQAKKDGTTTWNPVKMGTFTSSIPARSASGDGVSTRISTTVADLTLGATLLRAIVNEPVQANLLEVNLANNTSQEVRQNYLFDVAEVTLTADNSIVRYDSNVTLKWSVKADYNMSCTLSGSFKPGEVVTFITKPNEPLHTLTSAPLRSAQTFGITCKPQLSPGVPSDVVTKTSRVEVVPLVQET